MPAIFDNLQMPAMGQTFLSRADREWVIRIVTTIIGNMGVAGMSNLLVGLLPNESIDRINFREGVRNIAEQMVGMLEQRGALNPPEYHALGQFLVNLIDEDRVGFDASVKIISLLFGYTLVRNRARIAELSSRYQVPSPMLSTIGQPLSHVDLPIRLSGTEIQERLESLYHQGKRYILDVNFLFSGAKAASSVCRVEFDKRGEGTGFLVAPNLILTNYHVMVPPGYNGDLNLRAQKCEVRFGVIKDEQGGVSAGRLFKLHEKWLVAQSLPTELDYILIRLQRPATDEDKISVLSLEPRTVLKDAFVNIIQHPKGGFMEVSLRFNQVVAVENRRVYYLADTEKGSSGSPVFDDEWKVVALHRSGGELAATGKLAIEANAGVPIEAIQREIATYLNS